MSELPNIALEWMGRRQVVAADAHATSLVARLFPTLRVPARPGEEPGLILRRGPGGWEIRMGGSRGWETRSWPLLADALSHLEMALTRRFLASDGGHVHLHAAGAVLPGGGAILALGASGGGKSSLAYGWLRRGLGLLGDDLVLVEPEGGVRAFPRLLKVDARRLRAAGEAPEETLAWTEGAEEAWVDPAPDPGWAAGSHPVREVLWLDRDPGGALRSHGVHGGAALRLLLDSVHRTGIPRDRALDPLIRLAGGAEIRRITYGDFEALVLRSLGLPEAGSR